MEDTISSFTKLAGAVKSSPKGAEDYFDRLNYVITPGMLLIIATVVGMKQYVFQPIQCWCKKEFDGDRMQYIENYCWVENTYHFHPDRAIPKDGHIPAEQTIYYYQWVPFILMSQAALFYIPHLVWLLLSSNIGVDMQQLAIQSRSLETETDNDERQKKISFLSASVQKFIRSRKRYKEENRLRRCVSCITGYPAFAMYLMCAYTVVKLLYIGNCIGQLHLMRKFLGMNMTSFGFHLFSDIVNNRTWESTFVFPRVTFCNIHLRDVGQGQNYVAQCVLPVNMLNEKFYILIWFWIVVLLGFNAFSLCKCVARMILNPGRRKSVKKFLKIAECVQKFDRIRDLENSFIERFSKSDGSFLLMVISKNAGDIATAEVVIDIFREWVKDTNKYKASIVGYEKNPDGVAV